MSGPRGLSAKRLCARWPSPEYTAMCVNAGFLLN